MKSGTEFGRFLGGGGGGGVSCLLFDNGISTSYYSYIDALDFDIYFTKTGCLAVRKQEFRGMLCRTCFAPLH